MKTFSVIVPIYKTEKYLPKCIESITQQTYAELEIILVNDGSPDNCLQIMERYAANDGRIRIVSQANSGLSAARNAGMKIATGDYVAFIDSDDWVEKDMFEVLATHLDSEPSDYVCFRFQFDNEGTGGCHVYGRSYDIARIEGAENILKDTLEVIHIGTAACLKVYNRAFLLANGQEFEMGIVNEDTLFSIQVACHAKRVSFVNKVLYHATEREGSISRSSQERLFLDMHTVFLKAKGSMVESGYFKQFQKTYKARYLRSMLYNQMQAAQRLDYRSYARIMGVCFQHTFYRRYNKCSVRRSLSRKYRVMLICSPLLPVFFLVVRLMNKIGVRMH